MERLEFIEKFNAIGYGKLARATWKSETIKNGVECLKVSEGCIRFAHYGNINGVEVKGQENPNNETLLNSVLKYNSNTKNYLVQFTLDINDNHHIETTYYVNGVECDKATYEQYNPTKASAPKPTIVFYKKLQDVIDLGY